MEQLLFCGDVYRWLRLLLLLNRTPLDIYRQIRVVCLLCLVQFLFLSLLFCVVGGGVHVVPFFVIEIGVIQILCYHYFPRQKYH